MLTTAEQVRPLALRASEAGAHDRTQNMLLHWLEPSILQAHAMRASPKCLVNIHQSYLSQSSLSPALVLLWTHTDHMSRACWGSWCSREWVGFSPLVWIADRTDKPTRLQKGLVPQGAVPCPANSQLLWSHKIDTVFSCELIFSHWIIPHYPANKFITYHEWF